jgi:anti-sigma regulatory factor (Ser/Thr protein kinase)
MDEACDTIIRALNTRGGRKDDVALLMARLNNIDPGSVATWELSLEPREAARARRLVRGQLNAWGLEPLTGTAELLVGEVVANAVRHAFGRRAELRLVRADSLLCEVADDDHTLPTLLDARPDDEGGRGLRVLSALSREWGTSRTAGGKTVWFELALP